MGNFLLYAIFALITAKFAAYLFSEKNNIPGRSLSWIITAVGGFAFLLLLTFFTRENYAVRYVFENSARDMPLLYKISGVWAGQEGTFLLWLAMTSFCVSIAAKSLGDFERVSMLFASIVEMTLIVLLIRKSPFGLMEGGVPADGMGLNPLLKNPWMAIHPPVVFLGYALATIPFGASAAGVIRGQFDGWLNACRSWTLLAWGVLGMGIAMGSYWAYEVLGWGGYWGWDPVENASMLPWLTLGGLVHGLLLQKRRKDYAIWNIVLAQVSFFLVFFGTFMTRSGVLSNFSVHSFPGLELLLPLLSCLIAYALIAAAVIAFAATKLKNAADDSKRPMPQTLLLWTINVLAILCFFIMLGTTSPIISSWFLPQPSQVGQSFYNGVTYILGFILAVVLSICPAYFAGMKGSSATRLGLYAVAGVLAAGIGVLSGVASGGMLEVSLGVTFKAPRLMMLLMLFVGGSATAANIHAFALMASRKKWPLVSYLTHIGVAFMVVSVVLSTAGTKTKHIVMFGQKPAKWNGYEFKLAEVKPAADHSVAVIALKGNGSDIKANIVFVADQESRTMVKKPYIHKTLLKDLYMSPGQLGVTGPESSTGDIADLKKGEPVDINGHKVTFTGYDLSKMQQGVVAILIDIEKDGQKTTAKPQYPPRGDSNALTIGDMVAHVAGMDVASKSIQVQLPNGAQASSTGGQEYAASIEVSQKPGMALLWLGMILICGGTLLAFWRWLKPAPAETAEVAV